ncbi:MAG: phosphoserine phosphatase SerB [Antricoccus sp.]
MTNTVLVNLTGSDRPGVTTAVFGALSQLSADAAGHVDVVDIEQVVIRGQLVLGIELRTDCPLQTVRDALAVVQSQTGVHASVLSDSDPMYHQRRRGRHHVVVLGQPLNPRAISVITGTIAELGANIDRIHRLSDNPVTAIEFVVSGASTEMLRPALSAASFAVGVDVSVEKASLDRRSRRLIVMDVDSTLVRGEVIDSLAAKAGRLSEVAAITARAMDGELDFAQSLTARVAMLRGLSVATLDQVRRDLQLTPGASTLIRTLRRMGYRIGVVSGGFTQIIDSLVTDLGLDFGAANTLEVHDGVLTGRVLGPIIDRAGKAAALRQFADRFGIPMSQTVAVGDGANDLDMLTAAGLGIAFNAKPVVREQSDTSLNLPYLDALLFFLGISQDEVALD